MIRLRSCLFMLWFLAVTIVLLFIFLPLLLAPRQASAWLGRLWSRVVLWGLKVFAGLDVVVRGEIPKGPVLVASKHMSICDTLILQITLHDPGIVLKRELLRIPFYGWYLGRAGAIAVDRNAGASAMRVMIVAAKRVLAQGRQVLIFPEGTRKTPGAPPDYKPGVAGLYSQLGVDCVPVAQNSGVYWQGFIKQPGTVVLEFLPAIPPGLKRAEFMRELQTRIETATAALLP